MPLPKDSSNSDTRYWEAYWSFSSVYGGGGDYFNPDSCWAFGVGFSFLDMDTYYRDPGVWKTEVNMATKTNTTPKLLCDTLFYVIDDILPTAYIYNIQDSSYVGNTCTIQAAGWDNAFVGKTELYIDGVLIKSAAASALEYLWTVPQDEAVHVLQAKAYDVYNPPLQLGLCGVSKPIQVSRTNVQTTQIVASDNVKLFYAQTDTVLQGHFTSLYNFVEDTKYPVGVLIDANKIMHVKFDLNLECFNFGQPSRWQPVCKFKVELSGVPKALADSTFTGWKGNIIIDKEFNHIKDENFGSQTLVFTLSFEDINGNLISEQQIYLPCLVFFDKVATWHKERILMGWGDKLINSAYYKRHIVPNWFYYWSNAECFINSEDIQSNDARYAWDLPAIGRGAYDPEFNDSKYFIGPSVQAETNIRDTLNKIIRTDNGIYSFGFCCRHENMHKKMFLKWWESFNYWARHPELDRDNDYIPNKIEAIYGLDSLTKYSRGDINGNGTGDNFEMDFEYVVYKEHSTELWKPNIIIWDPSDYANPGKQTLPRW